MAKAELHAHLLPGVDDGAATTGDAVEIAALAAADGARAIVATPHIRPDFLTDVDVLPDLVREARAATLAAGVAIEIHQAGEVGHTMVGRLSAHELEAVAAGPSGSRWILLEAPFTGFGDDFHAAAAELRGRGYGVVIAHPERSAGVLDDGALAVRREVVAGSWLQVNAWSLTGGHGDAARAAADDLLRRGLVGVIASDAHADWRQPALTMAATELRRRGLDLAATRMLTELGPDLLLRRGLRGRRTRLAA